MKPLFKNTTIYNSKNYNQFIQFHGQKFNFSYNSYTLVMLILMLYCLILNILEKNILFILLFLVMLILTILFRMYIPLKRYQKTKKQYAKNKQSSYSFSFYNFHFTVGKRAILYFKLYKVFETKDYFYLYIDKENAILVSKTGFKLGTSEEFSDFIKKKCLLKYKKVSDVENI